MLYCYTSLLLYICVCMCENNDPGLVLMHTGEGRSEGAKLQIAPSEQLASSKIRSSPSLFKPLSLVEILKAQCPWPEDRCSPLCSVATCLVCFLCQWVVWGTFGFSSPGGMQGPSNSLRHTGLLTYSNKLWTWTGSLAGGFAASIFVLLLLQDLGQ